MFRRLGLKHDFVTVFDRVDVPSREDGTIANPEEHSSKVFTCGG